MHRDEAELPEVQRRGDGCSRVRKVPWMEDGMVEFKRSLPGRGERSGVVFGISESHVLRMR